MIEASVAVEILSALGYAAFQRRADGRFTPVGKPPSWSSGFPLSYSTDLSREQLGEVFPVLNTFLADAEEFWEYAQSMVFDSGPWTQPDITGTPCTFRALTITAANERFLLLSLPGAQFEESKAIIQKARNQSLAHGQMERRLAELESRSRAIEEMNRRQTELLAATGQELCTPVNAIVAVSAQLAERATGNLNEKQQNLVEEIGLAAARLLHVIEERLEVSKAKASANP